MVSFTAYSAAAVLAFSGMASAIPAYTYSNGTAATGLKGNGTSTGMMPGSTGNVGPASDSAYCPKLNGATVDFGSKTFFVECGKTHFGTQISISVGVAKRAIYSSLGDCISLCQSTATCVGTAFDLNARTCTLYSDIGAAVDAQGIDFAFVVANNGAGAGSGAGANAGTGAAAGNGAGAGVSSVSAGAVLTVPVYSTTVKTVLSCAPTVTNCPLRANGNNGGSGVVTELIPVTSTVYTCPAATTVPVTPLACTGCPYTPVTATQYSASSSGGVTSFVPVQTAVVNYPMPSGTSVTVTVCTKCAAATATGSNNNGNGNGNSATGSASKPSSTMAVYTGAAGQVKAGMGFAAFVAGAAILI